LFNFDGFETVIGERSYRKSEGEKLGLAIAKDFCEWQVLISDKRNPSFGSPRLIRNYSQRATSIRKITIIIPKKLHHAMM